MKYTEEKNIAKLKISPIYSRTSFSLDANEYNSLAQSIKESGQHLPIVVNKDYVILDGHTRYKICQELQREPIIEVKEFGNELYEHLFVIEVNRNRRHLNEWQRVIMALEAKPLYTRLARLNQQSRLPRKGRKGFQPISDKHLTQIGRVNEKVAKLAGVSYGTITKAEYIKAHATEEGIQDLNTKRTTIHTLFCDLKQSEQRMSLIQEASEINSKLLLPVDRVSLYNADFRDPVILAKIPDSSIDLIITDPPYGESYLPLYQALPQIVNQKLKPGGSFFSFFGDRIKDRFEQSLRAEGLVHNPCDISMELAGGTFSHDQELSITRKKRDMIWYYKGPERLRTGQLLQNLIKSRKPDKVAHPWEQSSIEAEEIISRVTLENVGAVVFDPMCGTGTNLIAALKLGRRAIGIDIDKQTLEIARANIFKFQLQ